MLFEGGDVDIEPTAAVPVDANPRRFLKQKQTDNLQIQPLQINRFGGAFLQIFHAFFFA